MNSGRKHLVRPTSYPFSLQQHTAEGQSPGKGKAKSSGLDPSSEGPARPGSLARISRTGSGKVAGLSGSLAGLMGSVGTFASLMGPAGLAEGRPGPSTDSGRNSEETRMAVGRNGSHNYKPGHHFGLSNEVKIMVKSEVKTGKTLDGAQVKREELNSWKTHKSLLDLRRQLLYSKEMF